MEDSEHRALWGALGVALLISGVVVLSDWTFVAVAAPPQRDLTALWWPWVFALVMMGMGVYFLVAVSEQRLWIPGRKKQEIRRLTRKNAELTLAKFHARGSRMSLENSATFEQYQAWRDALLDFVGEAWGLDQSAALNPPNHLSSVNGGFQEVTTLLARLIERDRILPIQDGFNPLGSPTSSWLTYWDISLPQDEE